MARARTKRATEVVTKSLLTGVPEGGVHMHMIQRDLDAGIVTTPIGGRHTHKFLLPSGVIVETEQGGQHVHSAYTSEYHEELEGGSHTHTIKVGEVSITTYGGYHEHQSQSDSTVIDGLHTHWLELGDDTIFSLTPQQISLMDGLSMGDVDEVLDTLRTSKQEGVLVEHANGKELRTSLWTLAFSDNTIAKAVRGWKKGGTPVWAGNVHVTYSDTECAEVWLTNSADEQPHRIVVTKNDAGSWSVAEGGVPLAFTNASAELPASVKKEIPEGARYWDIQDEVVSNEARSWLVETNWWDRFEKNEVQDGSLASFVEEAIGGIDVFSPMAGDVPVEKAFCFIHEAIDPDMIGTALESAGWLAIATAGTPEADALRKAAVARGLKVGFLGDDRTAGTVISTSLIIPVVGKVWESAVRERNALRENFEETMRKCGGDVGDEELTLRSASLVNKDACLWTDADFGVAARAVLFFKGSDDEDDEDLCEECGKSVCEKGCDGKKVEKVAHTDYTYESYVEATKGASSGEEYIEAILNWSDKLAIQSGEEFAKDSQSLISAGRSVLESIKLRTSVVSEEVVDTKESIHADVNSSKDTKELYKCTLLAKEADVEERFLYGIVMEPLEVDAHGDTQRAETIRQTAHGYMQSYRNVGLQHKQYINDKTTILESYIAPADITLKEGTIIKAGSWVMAVKVLDDKIWNAVKAGKITGFSIGGRGIRAPITLDVE